jgi:hypothetical protein
MLPDLVTPSPITCLKCGAERPDAAPSCPRCGAASEDGDVPLGTWSETGVAKPVMKEKTRPAPRLRVHRGGRAADSVEEHTPAPGLALALAPREPLLKADETGTRPRMSASNVVPLARAATARVEEAPAVPTPDVPRAADLVPDRSMQVQRTERRDPTPTGRTIDREPVKPPILASDLLAEDIAPTEPYRNPLRIVAVGAGLLGVIAIGASRPSDLVHWGVAGLLGVLAVLGAVPIGYRVRALATVVVAALGIGATSLAGGSFDWVSFLLVLAATSLAGGLFFRNAYRASLLGRGFTGVGLAIGAVWLTASFWGQPFNELGTEWQAWVPAALRLLSVLLGLLSLLAFMDSSTTGGSAIWGIATLVWFACERLTSAAIAMTAARDIDLVPLADATSAIAIVSVGALAIAGVLVTAAGGTREQRATRRR